MKRRRFIQSIAAAPIAPALLRQPPVATASAPAPSAAQAAEEAPKLEFAAADAAAETITRFFDAEQFATLRKLSDILMPALDSNPGALDARAAEFLDFLIGASAEDRRRIYKTGLDLLNAQARKRFNKPFSEIDAAQARSLLAPLARPWTYEPPADPLARFLREAKHDVRNATVNSREWNTADSGGGRRAGGIGQYWHTIE
jgi:hypothetical protein